MSKGFNLVATTSERLKEAMRLTGKKQADLVRETGIDKGSISHYVSGKYEPKDQGIHKLAVALDVAEMWLWGYDVPMDRPQRQKESDAFADITERLDTDIDFLTLVNKLTKDQELYELVMKVCSLDEEKRRSWSNLL